MSAIKNPNGYGSIKKLHGKRRRPFMVTKTTGWDENGKQKIQIIGYYETRSLAMMALAEFNKNPYSIDVSSITFAEVFEKWKENKFEKISKSNINGYNASFKTSQALHNVKFVEIRAKHMQDVVKNSGKGYGSLRKLKVLFNQLFEFAMENDIVSKDYSEFVDIGKNTEDSKRKVFTEKEIARLFELQNEIEFIDTILIMIYSGLRIGELLTIESENVDLEKRIMTGGLKTEAGKDRIVPISNKILHLVEKRLQQGYKYLIVNAKGEEMKYNNYYKERWTPIMEELGMEHLPHDCRHTFATKMGTAKADTVALQKIIGHASYVTTANTYTHKDVEELIKNIDLI